MNSPFAAQAPTPTDVLKWETKVSVAILVGISLLGVGLLILDRTFKTKILPNTTIDSVIVGGKTKQEALALLESKNLEIPAATISAFVDDIRISSAAAELGIHRNIPYLVDVAYEHGKTGTIISRLKTLFSSFKNKTVLSSSLTLDAEKVTLFVLLLSQQTDVAGKEPTLTLKKSGNPKSLVLYPGFVGRALDQKDAVLQIIENTQKNIFETNTPIASTSTELSIEQQTEFMERAKTYVGISIPFSFDKDTQLTLTDVEIVSLLRYPTVLALNDIKRNIDEWSKLIFREPNNAVFTYDEKTLKVTEFTPHRDGRALEKDILFVQLTDLLEQIPDKKSADPLFIVETQTLPVSTVKPEKTLAQTNTLGITERIGFGESYYNHSIPSRIHNVGITSDRINATIVPPGAEFSFNKTLGDISAQTGFKPAYVISGGKTQLGDGGGVCQVSSTLFRSVLDAGLDVTRRLQHSYRVSYYELNSDPGFDATVYSGNVDFRFINDTKHHVLIFTQNDATNLHLTIELFGTSDGRTTKISNYRKWDTRPALATEFIPDPTLPAGTRKQVDWAVSGIKTEFDHTVTTTTGEVLHQDTYYSNYRPWSAKYLVGTGG